MMKRTIALMLLLSLLSAAPARAETAVDESGGTGSTRVTYTVAENLNYIVTIPPAVELMAEGSGAAGEMTVRVSAPLFNNPAKAIAVRLTRSLNAFHLVCGGESMPYALALNGTPLSEGDRVLLWSWTPQGTDVTADLAVNAAFSVSQPAGQYTDTITFTVSVIPQP